MLILKRRGQLACVSHKQATLTVAWQARLSKVSQGCCVAYGPLVLKVSSHKLTGNVHKSFHASALLCLAMGVRCRAKRKRKVHSKCVHELSLLLA